MNFDSMSFDRSHLNPFTLGIKFGSRVYTARVMFSCHCFTTKFDPNCHGEEEVWECGHNKEKRAFDADRHQLSFLLPELFRDLGNKTVYHTDRQSFFLVRTVPVPGKGSSNVPYVVFFRVFKAKRDDIDIIVQVESAYPKPGMTQYASPVKFPLVVCSKALNEPLRPGPPCKVKRH